MRNPHPFSCDECGRDKREGNHWFRARVIAALRSFEIRPWDEPHPDWPEDKEIHLCSEACAVKAMSKAIASHAKQGDQQ